MASTALPPCACNELSLLHHHGARRLERIEAERRVLTAALGHTVASAGTQRYVSNATHSTSASAAGNGAPRSSHAGSSGGPPAGTGASAPPPPPEAARAIARGGAGASVQQQRLAALAQLASAGSGKSGEAAIALLMGVPDAGAGGVVGLPQDLPPEETIVARCVVAGVVAGHEMGVWARVAHNAFAWSHRWGNPSAAAAPLPACIACCRLQTNVDKERNVVLLVGELLWTRIFTVVECARVFVHSVRSTSRASTSTRLALYSIASKHLTHAHLCHALAHAAPLGGGRPVHPARAVQAAPGAGVTTLCTCAAAPAHPPRVWGPTVAGSTARLRGSVGPPCTPAAAGGGL